MGREPFDSSLFEGLLASFADNLYVFDSNLRYAFVTPTAAHALGLTPSDVIGRTWQELGLPPTVMEPVEKQVRSVLESRATVREETLFAGPHGPRYYEYVITFFGTRADGAGFVSVIGRDITDRKLAEARRVEVLESMGDAFFALDKDWRIVLVNRHQEAVSQTSRKDTIGRNFWEVFPATATENLKYWGEYHRTMEQRVATEFEEYYAPLDIWTEVRAFPTDDGGISVFFRDVTERKRAEQAVTLAHEFEKKIVAIVGHDIRNPLGAIDLAAQVLRRHVEVGSSTERTVERITLGVDRIRHIVDDLLDFTRARHGGIPVHLERSNLASLCKQVMEELQALTQERTIEFLCEGDAWGVWDPHRIAQAVSNIIGNAIQHSPKGTPISVSIFAEADAVALEVHNAGHIPANVLPNVFDPFRQGSDEQSARGGLGLGLYIAQTIVEAHSGRIAVESSPEHGTRFRITLPRQPVPQQQQMG